MGKKRKPEDKLTSAQVLQNYIATLPESKCKEAYMVLRERFDIVRPKIIKLNAEGVRDGNGRVRLRQGELDKLMKTTSDYKFHWLIFKLHNYLDFLAEKAESEAPAKRKLREYEKISHYHKLTKGWVAQAYDKEATPPKYNREPNTLDFYSIKTEAQAKRYIEDLPPELRINNPEIEWLVSVYPGLLKGKENV